MSIEGQGHFLTIYFPGFVCFVLYKAKISGERLQEHWSSGFNLQTYISKKIFYFISSTNQQPANFHFPKKAGVHNKHIFRVLQP